MRFIEGYRCEPDASSRPGLGRDGKVDGDDVRDLRVPSESLRVGQQDDRIPVRGHLHRSRDYGTGRQF